MNQGNLLCIEGDPIKINYPSYDFVYDENNEKVIDKEGLYEIDTSKNLRYRAKIIANTIKNPHIIPEVIKLCKHNILFYINTFCYTYRTDLSRKGKNPYVNVCTFPFQDDILTWMAWTYKENIEGLIEKSRDVGATWIWVWFESWLRLFHEGVTTLAMSQNENDVDNRTNKSIFEKTRINLRAHPEWLRMGWVENSPSDKIMAIKSPKTNGEALGAVAKGSAGRSGRGSVVFYDEFAHILEAPAMIEAGSALSPCKFYISTPKGDNNEFARIAQTAGVNKKTVHWTMHPLRSPLWEKKKRDEPSMTEEVFAQEYEVSYTKSNIGRVFSGFKSGMAERDDEWVHVQDDPYFNYDPLLPVYTASDFGRDMTYVGFFQIKPPHQDYTNSHDKCIVFFDEYAESNKTAYQIRKTINEKPYHYAMHIGDMRTAVAKDSLGKGWGYYLKEDSHVVQVNYGMDVGPPIEINGTFKSPNVYIDAMNAALNIKGALCFNSKCRIAVAAMNNWTYEINLHEKDMDGRPMLKYGAKPKHDKFSHPCTGLYYGVYYIINNLHKYNSSNDIDWSGFEQSFHSGI
jgi:hypothetical protein